MQLRDRIKELRRVPASELRPNPKNWRTHPQAQQDALRGVLAEVGIADAVLARELPDGSLMLVDGHLRAETITDAEVPVLVLDVNEVEADKILATLDPLAAMAEADASKLDALLREVQTGSEALAGMLEELAEDAGCLSAQPGEIVEDEVPEPPVVPITKPGDLWLLGRHRVMCGDSTKAEDVARLMNRQSVGVLLTDPPYGIGIASNPVRQKHAKQEWDESPADAKDLLPLIAMADEAIVWGGNYYDLPPHQCFLVWDKKQPEDFSVGMCEIAWTNLSGPAKLHSQSVTSYAKEHCTQKPVELIAWCIRRAKADGIIFDAYLGSGTTLIAAEQLNRTCYGMEISPQYCDVIVKRWEKLTGQTATLEAN